MDDIMRQMPKFGFGLMRLPKKRLNPLKPNIEQVKDMVDLFMNAGLKYFDTAFVYPGSEPAIKEALVERYPRDSFYLTTKINAFLMCHDEKSAKAQFEKSLERTGAGYFDFYLLHALMDNNYKKYDKYHLWDYVKDLKTKGRIKHYGFSFHGSPALLEELLADHPDVDFIQLQLNYADWENPSIASRANYEIARKHNVPIVVMEPIKGGSLANPPKAVQELFKEARPDLSIASWALRYAASLEGVMVVLSGMSNMEQMEDNLSYMSADHFKPLSAEEQRVIRKAQDILWKSNQIPCTACHYCISGCPKQILIPDVFKAMNQELINHDSDGAKRMYAQVVGIEHGKASECIKCGKCENACPQHLQIRDLLEDCAKKLEEQH